LLGAMAGNDEVTLDLASLVDLRKVSSKFLFELAVEKKQPELANLAWRISVAKTGSEKQASVKTTLDVLTPLNKLSEQLTVEKVIDKLNRTQAYWSVGAALIIHSVCGESSELTTLRQIATDYANYCWGCKGMPATSVLFKGFEEDGTGGLAALDFANGVERRKTFHVSPLYIGLRDGLIFCKKHGLVVTKNSVSTSSPNAKNALQAQTLSRLFYKLKATDKGKAVYELWADCEDYIFNFYKLRVQ